MDTAPVCHVQIRTHNINRAKRFYSHVFDWYFKELAPGSVLIDTGACPSGELMQVSSPEAPLGVCTHIQVRDCASTALQAAAMGGEVLFPRLFEPEINWFADTLDPWGNELAMWRPLDGERQSFQGSSRNAFCWIALSAADLNDAVSYYQQLFGWRFESDPETSDHVRTCTTPDGVGIGIQRAESTQAGTTTYIRVDDIRDSLDRIRAAGGRVLIAPRYDSDQGLQALFIDPEGNQLAIFEPVRH